MKRNTRIFDLLSNYQEEFNKEKMISGKFGGKWRHYSTEEFTRLVDQLSRGLVVKEHIKQFDKIALMSANRPEWNICDFAVNQLGAAIVPLYPTLANQDLIHILKDAEVSVIVLSNADMYKKVQFALQENDMDIPVYAFDAVEGAQSWKLLLDAGKENATLDLQPYRDAVEPDDLLTLIYTSGTTGKPKGVHLSHKNVMSNVLDCQRLLPAYYKKALSFLPLSHIFERMVVYLYISRGIEIHYAESLETVVADINDVKPDGFTTVPRVLEKVYDSIIAKGKQLSGIKKALFFWAVELGHQFQEPEKNSAWYNFRLGIARKLIFSKWQAALGGNIKVIISGGAALQPRLARIFWAANIPVLEGYGLTETSPVIGVNSLEPGGLKFGSIGKILDSVEVKIAPDGEILTRGPHVTKGYYHNPEATAELIDEEGWLHTGDIGELTSDGFLRITDRKKEIFKTAGGKYVAPQVLENKFMESIVIAQVMVIGENRRFPAALIVPAFDALDAWSKLKGLSFADRESMLKHPQVLDKYQREIDRLNEGFGQWEKVKKFALLPKEWTIDGGELTPKLSLKRKAILTKHEAEIEEIYAE